MTASKFEIQLSIYKEENFIPISEEEERELAELKHEGLIAFSDKEERYFLTNSGRESFEHQLSNR